MAAVRDLTGKKYGRLTVLRYAGRNKHNQPLWDCLCDCGKSSTVRGSNLTTGQTQSCGCLCKERGREAHTKHGHMVGRVGSRTHKSWNMMLQRCRNPKNPNYARYGAKGISVCDRWSEFKNFLLDMGERPDGCSLDRIDNEGNYEKQNCRWATDSEQVLNRSVTIWVSYQGQTVPLADLIRSLGEDYSTFFTLWHRRGRPENVDTFVEYFLRRGRDNG